MSFSISPPSSPRSPDQLMDFDVDRFSESHHLLLVGGGPRSVIQVNSEIVFMLLYRDHFDELIRLGANYDIRTTMVERRALVALGTAYCAGQTGMMNSGVEDDISFPLPVPPNAGILNVVQPFLSYKRRYNWYIGRDPDAYYRSLKKLNLPGSVLFKRSIGPMSSSKEGELDLEGAFLMRRTVGEEERATFEIARKLADGLLPFYKLNVLESTSVRGINAGTGGQQLVVIQKESKESPSYISADQVRLNTGTVTRNPVSNSEIQRFMFCQSANVDHFREYCDCRELLDSDALLRPGMRIISGGMGLSGLDQISLLDGIMNLFEVDDNSLLGYKVTDFAKRRYQNAVTLISRNKGKSCYPRHTTTPEWKQDTPVMALTEHLHALFLHSHGEEVFRIWYDILKASVARASNRTPIQTTNSFSSTEESLRTQFQESEIFLEQKRKAGDEEKRGNMAGKAESLDNASKTLYGAWRQASLSLIFGFGLEKNIEEGTKRMESYSPLTWKGRQTWLFHRAQISAITHAKFASKTSNMGHLQNFDELMLHVTSSPVEIHSMFHMLIEAGIATHEDASYSEIRCHPSGHSLELRGNQSNAFIVSPVFHRSEDETIQSLTDQVKPYRESHPSFGKVGKFRRFFGKNGKLLPIEDNGLGGRGFNFEKDGVTSRIGSFAIDLNNRASSTSVASSFTLRRMALAHLKAAGIESAQQTIDEIYKSSKPDTNAYNAEVKKFESHFSEVFEIWAYLKAIESIAGGDANVYRTLYDNGVTRDSRKEEVSKWMKSNYIFGRRARTIYNETIEETPMFEPPSRDDYYGRFVDTTEAEDTYMYEAAFKLARKHIQNYNRHQ